MIEWFTKAKAPEVGAQYWLRNKELASDTPAVVTAAAEGRVKYTVGGYTGLNNDYRTFNRIYEAGNGQ